MNGLIAELCANTMSAPNTNAITTTGISQNFFRTLRNDQISVANVTCSPQN
jgi:hypothetical protein